MKRVRYTAGAVGMAPALALGMPAMAAAQTHTPATNKSVSLAPVKAPATSVHPDISCFSSFTQSKKAGIFLGETFWHGHCLNRVLGILSKRQSGLEMRTRMYHQPGGPIFKSTFIHGRFSQNFTVFSYSPKQQSVGDACLALVNSKDNDSVKYGPVCMPAP